MQIFHPDNYFFNPYTLLHAIIGHMFLLLGLFVFIQNRKSLSNVAYFFICISIYLWLIFDVAIMSSTNVRTAVIWGKAVYFGACLIPPSMYFFFSCLVRTNGAKEEICFGGLCGRFYFYPVLFVYR